MVQTYNRTFKKKACNKKCPLERAVYNNMRFALEATHGMNLVHVFILFSFSASVKSIIKQHLCITVFHTHKTFSRI